MMLNQLGHTYQDDGLLITIPNICTYTHIHSILKRILIILSSSIFPLPTDTAVLWSMMLTFFICSFGEMAYLGVKEKYYFASFTFLLGAVFLSIGSTDIVSQRFCCCGSSPILCKMFNGTRGLRPLDASNIPSIMTMKLFPRHYHWSKIAPS